MKATLLKIFRWYFRKFPVRKGKIPVLTLISKWGLTDNKKLIGTYDSDIKINLDLDDWIQKLIYFFGCYEVEKTETAFWKKFVKDDFIILDIGANVGYYSLMAAKRAINGTIYAFEPVSTTYDKLKRNIALNNFLNIKPQNLAVSTHSGFIDIYVADNKNTGTSSITKHIHFNGSKERVKTTSIDEFVLEQHITRTDLIKIDVEGAEMLVLEGMRNTLLNFNPMVMVELIDERLVSAGSSLKEAYDFFDALGYKSYKLNRRLELVPSDKYLEGSLVIFKKS